MENEHNSKNPEAAANDSAAKATPETWHRQRHLALPLALGAVLIVIIFGLMVGVMAHSRQTVAKRDFAAGFNDERPMMMVGGQFADGQTKVRGRGLIGAVSKVDGDNITVHTASQDVVAVVGSTTSIYKNGAIAKQSDITTGEAVIVHGAPNSSGQITASSIEIE